MARAPLITPLVALALLTAASGQPAPEAPRIDPIAALKARLETGADRLKYEDSAFGYLKDLLAHLGVNPDSQMLVYSKTSFQSDLIGPAAPRSVFFNDTVAVGYVQGSRTLELMAATATEGYAFYSLDNDPAGPRFVRYRDSTCARCHGADNYAPGLIVASSPVAADGTPVFIPSDGPPRLFNFTDQTTPFAERWNGWYVTGTHGAATHQGNGAVVYSEDGRRLPGAKDAQNLVSLADKFDTRTYLSPHADIVALMTFEHQARMTNMLLAAGAAARRGGFPRTQLEDLLAYMLFVDEAPFPAPVAGTSGFTHSFPAKAPRDAKGRALRDFDLTTRLFKYPLSYMIYSPSFDALPADAKAQVYAALYAILTGGDTNPRFARLTADDRKAILEILQATKSDLPPAWKKAPL